MTLALLGYPRSGTFLGSKVKGQGHRVSKFILHTRTLHTRTEIHQHSLGGVTSNQHGFEIRIECLLVGCCHGIVDVCNARNIR